MPNITSIAAQKTDENKTMAIIVPAVNAPYNMRALIDQKKDFDLIPEPLGKYQRFHTEFRLQSNVLFQVCCTCIFTYQATVTYPIKRLKSLKRPQRRSMKTV